MDKSQNFEPIKVVMGSKLEQLLREMVREEIQKYEKKKNVSFRDKIKKKESKK